MMDLAWFAAIAIRALSWVMLCRGPVWRWSRPGRAAAETLLLAAVGGVGSVISQIGDLAASAVKRNYDIKDYGNLIPGHGGIMDRFDSVIFTAPITYFLIILFI